MPSSGTVTTPKHEALVPCDLRLRSTDSHRLFAQHLVSAHEVRAFEVYDRLVCKIPHDGDEAGWWRVGLVL